MESESFCAILRRLAPAVVQCTSTWQHSVKCLGESSESNTAVVRFCHSYNGKTFIWSCRQEKLKINVPAVFLLLTLHYLMSKWFLFQVRSVGYFSTFSCTKCIVCLESKVVVISQTLEKVMLVVVWRGGGGVVRWSVPPLWPLSHIVLVSSSVAAASVWVSSWHFCVHAPPSSHCVL